MAVNRRRKGVMHWVILLSLLFATEVQAALVGEQTEAVIHMLAPALMA